MLPLSVELFPNVHCSPILMYVIRMPQGYDDSEHRSGPAFCEWHSGKIAALASGRNGEQTQGVTSILPRSSGALLQGKRLVENGADAR